MKTYSIGRDLNCDIVINDSTDVISRRHALLNVTPSGKMTIIDQSSNGTYVNGIRITQNVPVPVTRKDIVSLAHVAKLDWNQVPKSNQWIKYSVAGAVVVVVILGIIFGVKHIKSGTYNDENELTTVQTESTDSIAIKQKEAARLDSIRKVERQDSINKVREKARQDSINARRSGTKPPQNNGGDKSTDSTGDDNATPNKKRTIG